VTAPLPDGFRVELDPGTKQLTDSLWFGGSPARVLRLTAAGQRAWRTLQNGPVESPATGALARRFIDAGLAHPVPPQSSEPPDVTIVIPVHNRAEALARCLGALDGRHPVLVVDDASSEPAAIAAVAAEHSAKLVRRSTNGGPARARNTALEHVTTHLVAFLDSDCVPSPKWTDRLAAHFADPALAAVAPRIRPLAPDSWAGRYTRAAGSLDLGDQQARVAPGARVSYVPTAALVARRSALDAVAKDGAVFDATMRVGEDVDLIWRLHNAGSRVRYDPSVPVHHEEPTTWSGLLSRRFRYGTSAAPLARRHPGAMAPLVLHAWPALTVGGLLTRRPLIAAAGFVGAVLSMRNTLRRGDIPTAGVTRAMTAAVHQTWLGAGRYSTQFAAPALAAVLVAGGRHRLAAASLLLSPPLTGWLTRRPGLDPLRYSAAAIADDIAYGSGVWAGCLTHRTAAPLCPRIAWRPLRIDRKGQQ
jgi:mycofactocin system glycosyltransferase